jgi:hypothetical protein
MEAEPETRHGVQWFDRPGLIRQTVDERAT